MFVCIEIVCGFVFVLCVLNVIVEIVSVLFVVGVSVNLKYVELFVVILSVLICVVVLVLNELEVFV